VDDLLDVAGTTADTGKAVRADARKTTFVSFSGVDGARQLAEELCETADRALAPFGARANRLRELSAFVAARRL
jgi:farnesyl diphosphate synthase